MPPPEARAQSTGPRTASVAHEEASQTIVAADQTYGWAQFLVRLARKGAPKALSVAEDPVTWNRIFSVIARFDPKLVKMSDDGKNED